MSLLIDKLNTHKMKKSTKILATVAAGMAIGGTLGLLYAPDKGSETRAKLDRKLKKLNRDFNGGCSKEQLEFVKGKLEQHKQRLEKHLLKINERIAEKEVNL